MLHQTIDIINQLIFAPAEVTVNISLLIEQLMSLLGEKKFSPFKQNPSKEITQEILVMANTDTASTQDSDTKSHVSETIRISAKKMDSLLLLAEEMLSVKLSEVQRVEELRDFKAIFDNYQKEWAKVSLSVKGLKNTLNKNNSLDNSGARANLEQIMEFFDNGSNQIKSMDSHAKRLIKTAEHDRNFYSRIIDNLLEDSKKILMLPFSSVLDAFPKIVRDISRAKGKTIEFFVSWKRS